MTFGEKIQKLRKESGLSQEELADQLNVSRQAVVNGNVTAVIRKPKKLSG